MTAITFMHVRYALLIPVSHYESRVLISIILNLLFYCIAMKNLKFPSDITNESAGQTSDISIVNFSRLF